VGDNTHRGINANFVVINIAITAVGPTWSVAGTGDLNGDGMPTLYGSRPAAPSSCGR